MELVYRDLPMRNRVDRGIAVTGNSRRRYSMSRFQLVLLRTNINIVEIMMSTLKNGTKIMIQRPAAEIVGLHHTYANNPFEKITLMKSNPRIYLSTSIPF